MLWIILYFLLSICIAQFILQQLQTVILLPTFFFHFYSLEVLKIKNPAWYFIKKPERTKKVLCLEDFPRVKKNAAKKYI